MFLTYGVAAKEYTNVLQRYAEIDFDGVVDVIEKTVSTWSVEDIRAFLNETLETLMSTDGGKKPNISLDIKGRADFIIKFRSMLGLFSTAYLRVLVDYLLAHPVEFNGYSGSRVNTNKVMSHIMQEVNSNSGGKYDEINPFSDFNLDMFETTTE